MDIKKSGTCSLCGGPYERYGNNPWPVREVEERCCDKCNETVVIPARLVWHELKPAYDDR
jgi:hypothetical protein